MYKLRYGVSGLPTIINENDYAELSLYQQAFYTQLIMDEYGSINAAGSKPKFKFEKDGCIHYDEFQFYD